MSYTTTQTIKYPRNGTLMIHADISAGTLTINHEDVSGATDVINTSGMYALDIIPGKYTFTVSDTCTYDAWLVEPR